MAILISGIGRSGTTTLYKIIGNAMLAQDREARCVYEPYLWSIPEIESTADTQGQPFSVGQIGLFNMAVHCNTPLFLSGRHQLHDSWLRKVFGPVAATERKAPGNVMAKVIRGSGRLEAALTRFDNLKVVIVTRNVVDTINSGLGLFCFYGDEFHPSDRYRFIKEVNDKFKANLDISKIKGEIEWATLWWHYFTLASINTYKKYENRVMLVPYEKYVEDKQGVMKDIFQFCGLEQKFLNEKLYESNAGKRTSVSYLDTRTIENLNDELGWYFKQLESLGIFSQDPLRYRNQLVSRYRKRKQETSLILTDKLDHTGITWRALLKNCRDKLSTAGATTAEAGPRMLTIAQAMCDFGSNELPLAKTRQNLAVTAPGSRKPTLGVLITCYNNRDSIEESIYSVLSQSKRPDVIVVADDCSTDGSGELLGNLAKKHQSIQLVLRPANVGVAANRDLAIRGMDVDYVTTLDGDDLFLPGKLELEYHALNGRMDKVAFSNIALVNENGSVVLDTSAYSEIPREDALLMLTSRAVPVPRDMMFAKALFEAAEGFDVALHMYEDWALKIRLMHASGDRGWVWSGGIGTVYDRRNPGLSGKPPIFHAHGQMVAIARNAEMLRAYPNAMIAGLRTAFTHLGTGTKEKLLNVISDVESTRSYDALARKLEGIWSSVYLGSDQDRRREDILRLLPEREA